MTAFSWLWWRGTQPRRTQKSPDSRESRESGLSSFTRCALASPWSGPARWRRPRRRSRRPARQPGCRSPARRRALRQQRRTRKPGRAHGARTASPFCTDPSRCALLPTTTVAGGVVAHLPGFDLVQLLLVAVQSGAELRYRAGDDTLEFGDVG